MSPPSSLYSSFHRRPSTVLCERSPFREISARADELECGSADSSSGEAIATHLLSKQQDLIETCLREQQQALQRLHFLHLIDLLRFSAHCTLRASLVCGALFRHVLLGNRSITRIQNILASPSCHSRMDDLLLALKDLVTLFSDRTVVKNIGNTTDLLTDLAGNFKRHRESMRFRLLSPISAMKSRAKAKLNPESRLGVSSIAMSDDSHGSSSRAQPVGRASGVEDVEMVSTDSPSSQRSVNSRLHRVGRRLHQIESSMFAVSKILKHVETMVSGAHERGSRAHQQHVEWLEMMDDPLWFDSVVAHIAGSDSVEGLRLCLVEVREQVLLCFDYINRARALCAGDLKPHRSTAG